MRRPPTAVFGGARPQRYNDDGSERMKSVFACLLGLVVVLGYYALPITAIHDQERLLLPII